ncbi:c-type heme family protein [Flagellimonas nanhaiensis]|uniref:DUF3365 domain-containing protein n=1 Tax=Flagellimonas nanhaiensis TaxID=2292706 RepID=A0A371JRD4_9FLAO|nr:DUF3365 domain-containing protein [Allomuricauda nanhaiensis]RDY60070.1 DUF3365 domain-containing protein [Allomuricauda nanhaiensis]
MKSKVLFILFIFLMFSCKKKPDSKISSVEQQEEQPAVEHEGKKLMETKCYLCHSPSEPEKGTRIGPPMVAIKGHYLEEFKDKEGFVNAISDFIKAPSQEKVKLTGAVQRFGLMPYQYYPEQEIQKIAEYMFEYQIEEPEWFKEHWEERRGGIDYNPGKKENNPVSSKLDYNDIGLKYALGTKKVLGKNLMGTIQNKGEVAAVAFCNERAYPLTDSMAIAYNARIKRVSDKPRNPKNRANEIEKEHIATFKKELAEGNSIEPIIVEEEYEVNFYYPIVTNSMCLKCHGYPSQEVQEQLSLLYPEDLAVGYDVDQVRGIWSIVFDADAQ